MLLWVRGMGKMPIPPTFYFLLFTFTFLLLILFLKLQFELSSAKQVVAHAVVWRGAVQAYALAVRLRGIATMMKMKKSFWTKPMKSISTKTD
jgi:hypothetical protein